MKTINEIFAFNLKSLRGDRSQATIAELAGIPFRTYQNIEAGNIPQRPNLEAVCRALKVPEWRLFVDPDNLPKPTPQQAIEILSATIDALEAKVKELEQDANAWRSLGDAEKEALSILAAIDQPESRAELVSILRDSFGLSGIAKAESASSDDSAAAPTVRVIRHKRK